jgi:hypothetical protein
MISKETLEEQFPNLRIVFVRNDDSYISIVKDIAQEFMRDYVVPFLGAGISIDKPSNLLSSIDLIQPLRSALETCLKYAIKDIKPTPNDLKFKEKILENVKLEKLLDAFHKTHGQPALEYLSVLNITSWNYNHASIAALVKHKYLSRCVTLNFDLLIEEAVAAENLTCSTKCPLICQEFTYGHGDIDLHILKPHGSFTPPHISNDFSKHLSATLSQVGSKPNILNINSFQGIFLNNPSLLIAGYSDDDWDIFPIIDRLKYLIRRIFWVQYASDEQVNHKEVPILENSETKEAKYDALHKRIMPFLNSHKSCSILLIGSIKNLFEDILKELKIETSQIVQSNIERKIPNTPHFLPVEDKIDLQALKTILSLAILINETGSFSLSLLYWLKKNLETYNCPELLYQIEDLIGHTKHTWGNIRNAICHTKKVIAIKSTISNDKSFFANDFIWLGYEYLCMAKRPNIKKPFTILLIPIYVIIGFRLLKKGTNYALPSDRKKLRSFACYYKIDLLHSWGNLLMLFSPYLCKLFKPLFLWILTLYSRLSQETEIMESEYYWLRFLEVKIMAGVRVNKEDTDKMFDELERSYKLVQNNVQQGNIYAYKALVSYNLNPDDKTTPIKYLDEAEKVWKDVGGNISSGFRRIILFRRFIGQLSFFEAIRLFLKNSA